MNDKSPDRRTAASAPSNGAEDRAWTARFAELRAADRAALPSLEDVLDGAPRRTPTRQVARWNYPRGAALLAATLAVAAAAALAVGLWPSRPAPSGESVTLDEADLAWQGPTSPLLEEAWLTASTTDPWFTETDSLSADPNQPTAVLLEDEWLALPQEG